jgi:hypothetical protein
MPKCVIVDTVGSPINLRIAGVRLKIKGSEVLLKCMAKQIGELLNNTFQVRYVGFRSQLQAVKRPLLKLSTAKFDKYGMDC